MPLFGKSGISRLGTIGILLVCGATLAHAAPLPPDIYYYDEDGNAVNIRGGVTSTAMGLLLNDTGPGGLANALTYNSFPGGWTTGDLILTELSGQSDVIRFTGPNTLVFYSDIADGADSLADIGFPTANYTNVLTLTETGPEGANGIVYTPIAGQPGFEAGFATTYNFFSDGDIPEPGTAALGLLGAGFIALKLRRRQSRESRPV